MQPFETQNAADGTVLRGGIYRPDHPRAVMTLVHGFGEHQGRYLDMIEHLIEENIAIVTMDLRGHGASDGKRGVCLDYSLLIGDVDAQLRHTREIFPNLPNYLYGHSMGGGLVLRYASEAKRAKPLAALLVSAPLITLPKPPAKPLEWIVKLLRRIAPEMVIKNAIHGDKVSNLAAEQARYESDPLNHGHLGVGLAVDLVENGDVILARAKEMTSPILLMHAVDDQLTSIDGSRQFAARAPNCSFHEFENSQHELHNDAPREQVYKLMTDFMTEQDIT